VRTSRSFSRLGSHGAHPQIFLDTPGWKYKRERSDWNITERLKTAGKMLDIPLLDHIIVTEDKHVSMRESSRWDRSQSTY
jgi:hypothetical protein